MLHVLYIYVMMGLLTVWATLEFGNREAKEKGVTLLELHEEARKEMSPEVREVSTIWMMFAMIFITWFIYIPMLILKMIEKDNG